MAAAGFTTRRWADMVDDDDTQDCFPSVGGFALPEDDISRDGIALAIPKRSTLFDLAVENSNDGVNLALKKIDIVKEAAPSVWMTTFPPLTAAKQSSSAVQLKEIRESNDTVIIKTAPAPAAEATTPTRSAAKRSYFSALTGRSQQSASAQSSAQKMEPAAKKEKVAPSEMPAPAISSSASAPAPSQPVLVPTTASKEESEEDKRVRRALRFGGSVPMPKLNPKLLKETDPTRLRQRQKQIDLGKNTIGYQNYIAAVPKNRRRRHDQNTPSTPDKTMVIPKKKWDLVVRAWRRALHEYDPPKPEGASAMDESTDRLSDDGAQSPKADEGPAIPTWRDVPAPPPAPAADADAAKPATAEPAPASASSEATPASASADPTPAPAPAPSAEPAMVSPAAESQA